MTQAEELHEILIECRGYVSNSGTGKRLKARIDSYLAATSAECICPKCGLRHGGKRDDNPGF